MIRFWKDTWLGETPLCTRYNRLFHLEKDHNCLIRDRIVNGSWSWDWCRPVNAGRTYADLNNLLVEISSLVIDVDSDSCIWSLSNDGIFSVSDVRKHIDDCMLPSSLPGTRWCKVTPKKVNIFM